MIIHNHIKINFSFQGFGDMRGGQDDKAVGEGGGPVDMQNCSYRGAHKVMMMTHKVMMLTMTHKLIVF